MYARMCVSMCERERERENVLVQGLAGLSQWQLNLYPTNILTTVTHTHTHYTHHGGLLFKLPALGGGVWKGEEGGP